MSPSDAKGGGSLASVPPLQWAASGLSRENAWFIRNSFNISLRVTPFQNKQQSTCQTPANIDILTLVCSSLLVRLPVPCNTNIPPQGIMAVTLPQSGKFACSVSTNSSATQRNPQALKCNRTPASRRPDDHFHAFPFIDAYDFSSLPCPTSLRPASGDACNTHPSASSRTMTCSGGYGITSPDEEPARLSP